MIHSIPGELQRCKIRDLKILLKDFCISALFGCLEEENLAHFVCTISPPISLIFMAARGEKGRKWRPNQWSFRIPFCDMLSTQLMRTPLLLAVRQCGERILVAAYNGRSFHDMLQSAAFAMLLVLWERDIFGTNLKMREFFHKKFKKLEKIEFLIQNGKNFFQEFQAKFES